MTSSDESSGSSSGIETPADSFDCSRNYNLLPNNNSTIDRINENNDRLVSKVVGATRPTQCGVRSPVLGSRQIGPR